MQPHSDPNRTRSLGPLQQDLPPQVIIINSGGNSNKQADAQLRTYNTKKAKTFGIIQIVAGSLCILLNIIDAIVTDTSTEPWQISSGWWGAPFVVIAGALGVASSMYPVRRLVNHTMAFSIVSSVAFIPMIVQGGLGVHVADTRGNGASIAVNVIFITATAVELIVSILQSIVCCSATSACCREPQQQSNQTAQPMNVYYNGIAAEQQSNRVQLQHQVSHPTAIQQQQHVVPVVQQQSPEQLQQQQSAYPSQAGPSVIMTSPLALGANTRDLGQSYSLSSMGAGPSDRAAGSSSGLPGPSSRLPGPSSGFMYPENPPAYDSITNNVNQAVASAEPVDDMEQEANMDSKITEWAHREMQLSDNIEYRL